MDGCQAFNCFQFHWENFRDQQIKPTLTDFSSFVFNSNFDLPFKRDALILNFYAERLLIYILSVPGTERAMNFNRRADYFSSKFIHFLAWLPSCDDRDVAWHLHKRSWPSWLLGG